MTSITSRQRTKISAALCLIHDNGYDAKSVQRTAQAYIGQGVDTKTAYERAFTDFVRDKPALGSSVVQTLDMLDRSDDAAVARYGSALETYNQTGDPSALHDVEQSLDSSTAQPATPEVGPGANGGALANARVQSTAPVRATFAGKSAFSGQDANGSATYKSAGNSRAGSFQPIPQQQQVEPGQGPVITKGWTESNVYG